jgi:capsid protein
VARVRRGPRPLQRRQPPADRGAAVPPLPGHKLIDGESLLLPYWLPDRVGRARRYATAFLGVDPDRLSNPYQGSDTRYMRGGVEIDDLACALAYHIRKAEPNDWYNAVESMQWERVPARTRTASCA